MALKIKDGLNPEQLTIIYKDFKKLIKFKIWLTSDEIKYNFIVCMLKLLSWGTAKQLTITTKEICDLYSIYQPNFKIVRDCFKVREKPYKHKIIQNVQEI